jgi:predicted HicB family RNase H-like nuclease
MPKTETLNLRVSPEFKRRLKKEANKAKRSVTNYIEVALSDFWTLKSSGRRPKKKDFHLVT